MTPAPVLVAAGAAAVLLCALGVWRLLTEERRLLEEDRRYWEDIARRVRGDTVLDDQGRDNWRW